MVGITEFSALLASIKSAKDIAEAMVTLRDANAMKIKIMEFNNAIMDAQQRVLAAQEERASLVQKVGALENKLAKLEHWETEKKRYELKRVGYAGTAVVYALKEDMADGELAHSICASCYQGAEKSILQGDRVGGDTYLTCPKCKTRLITGGHGTRGR